MATTPKKPATTKTGMAKSNAAKSSSGKTNTAAKKRNAPPQKKPQDSFWGRVSAGLLCFVLAMFVLLCIAEMDAVFLTLLGTFLKGVMGAGFWLMAPALLLAAYLFLFRQREPVTMRVICGFLLAVLIASLVHIATAPAEGYALNMEGIQLLWANGQLLQGGGAVSGLIAEALTRLFSKVGAVLILLMALALLVLAAFRITPETIVKAIRITWQRGSEAAQSRRERYYEDDYDEDHYEESGSGRGKAALDLPLDERTGEIIEETPQKRGLFDRNPRVKRPDEVVETLRKKPSASQPEPTPEAPPVDVTPPVPEEPIVETSPLVPPMPGTPLVPDMPIVPDELPELVGDPNPPFVAPDPEPVLELLDEPLTELSKSEKKQAIREQLELVSRDVATSLEQVPQEYNYPPTTLLHEIANSSGGAVQDELAEVKNRLSETIRSFGIEANIVGAIRGPSVTRYEVELEQGVRLNKLTNLADDIALALGASGVRIAPVPGKISLVGIEVPNQVITAVWIREVIESQDFAEHKSKVSFAVGKDIGGNYIVGDAARLPHLLIAGTTGSGKSVCTNSLIISLLFKASPEEVRLIMVDPKMVELGIYNGIPHLLIPVVTDPKKAAGALQWAVTEMMKRYRMFSEAGVRELASYNNYALKQGDVPKLPQIVIVIDELADLMLVAAKEVEESICRVAQMGRAAGMHLIIATQRPSADVITGLMKANIPSRIAFAVASSLESRIILDTQGAEKLVGKGDMLWFPLGAGKPLRVQGCLIDDSEVSAVVEHIKANSESDYDEAVLQEIEQNAQEHNKGSKGQNGAASAAASEDDGGDELLPAAVDIILELGQASASMLQRRLKLGYARASRLIDQMEDRGIVGPHGGSKPRQILISKERWDEMQGRAPGHDDPFAQPPVEEPDDVQQVITVPATPAPEVVPLPEEAEEDEELPPWIDE